jgi:chaperone modulatory protein CbpM
MAAASHQRKDIAVFRCRPCRVRLIRDLQVDFGLNAEGIAIVLHLLDQLHGLRSPLRDICAMQVANRARDIG